MTALQIPGVHSRRKAYMKQLTILALVVARASPTFALTQNMDAIDGLIH